MREIRQLAPCATILGLSVLVAAAPVTVRSAEGFDQSCAAELREKVGEQVSAERLDDLIAAQCTPSTLEADPETAAGAGPPASPLYEDDAGATLGAASDDVEIEERPVESVPPEAVPSPASED